MRKRCGPRANFDSYSKNELINLAVAAGLQKSKAKATRKSELCELLGLNIYHLPGRVWSYQTTDQDYMKYYFQLFPTANQDPSESIVKLRLEFLSKIQPDLNIPSDFIPVKTIFNLNKQEMTSEYFENTNELTQRESANFEKEIFFGEILKFTPNVLHVKDTKGNVIFFEKYDLIPFESNLTTVLQLLILLAQLESMGIILTTLKDIKLLKRKCILKYDDTEFQTDHVVFLTSYMDLYFIDAKFPYTMAYDNSLPSRLVIEKKFDFVYFKKLFIPYKFAFPTARELLFDFYYCYSKYFPTELKIKFHTFYKCTEKYKVNLNDLCWTNRNKIYPSGVLTQKLASYLDYYEFKDFMNSVGSVKSQLQQLYPSLFVDTVAEIIPNYFSTKVDLGEYLSEYELDILDTFKELGLHVPSNYRPSSTNDPDKANYGSTVFNYIDDLVISRITRLRLEKEKLDRLLEELGE